MIGHGLWVIGIENYGIAKVEKAFVLLLSGYFIEAIFVGAKESIGSPILFIILILLNNLRREKSLY